jgi:hypothetical protein
LNAASAANNVTSTVTKTESMTEWKRDNVIYGHIHMAKTAGTTINGELASHFERVCGHKGYSFDAYQFNERIRLQPPQKRDVGGAPGQTYKRGKVPISIMTEIGFEDCDWISHEVATTTVWKNLAAELGPLEIHVPCRDPIDHLLSQCNYRKRQFDCSAKNLTAEIRLCEVYLGRFRNELLTYSNTSIKCFDPIPIDGYIDYMSSKLQRKRVENQYVHRETNSPRQKSSECLRTQPDVASKVRELLLTTYDYYRFCDTCMSSDKNLLRDWTPPAR